MTLEGVIDRVEAAAQRLVEVNQRSRKRRALARVERRLARALARAWRIQGRDFLARFESLRDRFIATEALREADPAEDWERLFSESQLRTLTVFAEPLSAAVEASLATGARHAIADFGSGVTFSLRDPEATAYLQRSGAELVTGINEETRGQLRTLLAEARSKGWSYDKTAKEIRAKFTGFEARRARLVAVTETGNAYEASRRVVADRLRAAGLDMEKSWLAVGDERTDADCLANQAAGWIPVDQAFPTGHDQPTAHPACRCSCLYQRKAA